MTVTQYTMFTGRPKMGQWYKVFPEKCCSSDGSPWYGYFKKGKVNKTILYFHGGGVSWNEEMAAADNFYSKHPASDDNLIQNVTITGGIISENEENPFHNWNVIVFPYSTGDFHIGSGEFPYKDHDLNQKLLYHEGFTNVTGLLDQVVNALIDPEYVLITGFSAGGFGSALLARYVVEHYFYNADRFGIISDAACLVSDKWKYFCDEVWHAKKAISDLSTSDNIVADCLIDFKKKFGVRADVMNICSKRDAAMTIYQCYHDNGFPSAESKFGDVAEENIAKMDDNLKNANVLSYIWDDLEDGNFKGLTVHCIIDKKIFYKEKLKNGKTMADWVVEQIGESYYD